MRAITGSGDALGDLIWEGSRHGEKGWATGFAGTRAGASPQRVMMWGDAVCNHIKVADTVLWTQIVRPGKVPATLLGNNEGIPNAKPGNIAGGYWGGFGGASSTRVYAALQDRVIRSDDGGDTWADTAVTGYTVYSNGGVQRAYGPKGATDDVNTDVFYIGMNGAKLIVSLDGGVTKTQPASLPAPNKPAGDTTGQFTCVAVDESSTMTGGGSSRRSRVAASPGGRGVWLSTDGGVTFSDITGSSGITSVSNLTWINGKLLACMVGNEGPTYTDVDLLKKYDPSGGTWTTVAHGIDLNHDFIQFVVPDPRYTNGYWAFTSGGAFLHTQNGTTFVIFSGLGGTAPNRHYGYAQTRPGERPLVAQSYRYDALAGAISCGGTCNGRLYIPLGFGVLSTPTASFPLAGTDYTTPMGAAWPTWLEETAGIEEIVGQNVEWIYNTVDSKWELWCGGQDCALIRWEDGSRGHLASVYKWPAQRSDSNGIQRGMVPGFAACRRNREDDALPAFSYTLNGKDWVKCSNQPYAPNGVTSGGYECGIGLAHAAGQLSVFPTRVPSVPYCTSNLGATPWQEIDFYIGATKLDMSAWKNETTDGATPPNFVAAGVVYNGFQGSNFANQHHNACIDPTTGDSWCVNIGATDNDAIASWAQVPDPKGWAGIYKMAANEFGVFRRQYTGHPAFYSNFAYFDCKLIADGAGHLLFIPNYLPGSAPGDAAAATQVKPALYNIAGNSITRISAVWNCQGISFGAPYPGDTNKCLWLLGWGAGGWGVYYSRDLGATVKGPFAVPPGGYAGYIAAHPAEWGVVAVPRVANGHAIGRFRLAP